MTPKAGQPAPAFTATAHDGKEISLSDFRGKNVVLYFYPKDDTPGCTTQACDFRDAFPRFTKSKAVVLGVSADSVESHVKFRKKYDLPFTLIADPDKVVCKAYGVWQQKKMFAVKYMGVVRTTFLIDRDGVLRKVFTVKRVAGHADAVELALNEM